MRPRQCVRMHSIDFVASMQSFLCTHGLIIAICRQHPSLLARNVDRACAVGSSQWQLYKNRAVPLVDLYCLQQSNKPVLTLLTRHILQAQGKVLYMHIATLLWLTIIMIIHCYCTTASTPELDCPCSPQPIDEIDCQVQHIMYRRMQNAQQCLCPELAIPYMPRCQGILGMTDQS